MTGWFSYTSPWSRLRSLVVLGALVWGTAAVRQHPERPGLRLATLILLVAVTAAWLYYVVWRPAGQFTVTGIVVCLATGLALAIVHPQGPAVAFPAIACWWAAYQTPRRWAIPLTAGTALLYPLTGLFAGFGWWIVSGPVSFVLGLTFGLIRAQREALAAETQLAQEERARSAALAERGRIAREIHDVLAHSLAALTVQLETADALLEGGRVEQARGSVARAGQLAREGLAETRRAIGALRGDTLPLPDLLTALAAQYRADFQTQATVGIAGQPTDLGADTSLTLYRSAQEAMTNVRKHAPGAPVRLDLRYAPGEVSLHVANGPAPAGTPHPLAAAGGGYGLVGLRERAKLAGGSFDAGPAERGYRVDVRIPV